MDRAAESTAPSPRSAASASAATRAPRHRRRAQARRARQRGSLRPTQWRRGGRPGRGRSGSAAAKAQGGAARAARRSGPRSRPGQCAVRRPPLSAVHARRCLQPRETPRRRSASTTAAAGRCVRRRLQASAQRWGPGALPVRARPAPRSPGLRPAWSTSALVSAAQGSPVPGQVGAHRPASRRPVRWPKSRRAPRGRTGRPA